MLAVILNSILSGVVFWMAFCRLDKTTVNTLFTARLAIWFNGIVNLFIFFSPFYWDYTPSWGQVLVLCALVVTTAKTMPLWLQGVPRYLHRSQ